MLIFFSSFWGKEREREREAGNTAEALFAHQLTSQAPLGEWTIPSSGFCQDWLSAHHSQETYTADTYSHSVEAGHLASTLAESLHLAVPPCVPTGARHRENTQFFLQGPVPSWGIPLVNFSFFNKNQKRMSFWRGKVIFASWLQRSHPWLTDLLLWACGGVRHHGGSEQWRLAHLMATKGQKRKGLDLLNTLHQYLQRTLSLATTSEFHHLTMCKVEG